MGLMAFFANIFGYVLNFLYELVGNFGLAIILFSILIKLLMLPISWAQQKTMKKSKKVNDEMKQIQFKYKNDQEKMNQEIMALYKREKMNPASGCLSAIIQIVLLLAVFTLVRSPLTYMKKIDPEIIKNSIEYVQQKGASTNYKEIAVINYISNLENKEAVSNEQENQEQKNIENNNEENNQQDSSSIDETNSKESNNTEETDNKDSNNVEENNNKEESNNSKQNNKFDINEHKDKLYINMNFLGIDLSKVPTEDLTNIKALIIPILYVITSFISIRMSTNMNKKEKKEKLISDGSDNNIEAEGKEEENENKAPDLNDAMEDTNRKMAWFMPLMSISIAMVAPLGLALYWLMNNILMILERLILNKIVKEEGENNA